MLAAVSFYELDREAHNELKWLLCSRYQVERSRFKTAFISLCWFPSRSTVHRVPEACQGNPAFRNARRKVFLGIRASSAISFAVISLAVDTMSVSYWRRWRASSGLRKFDAIFAPMQNPPKVGSFAYNVFGVYKETSEWRTGHQPNRNSRARE